MSFRHYCADGKIRYFDPKCQFKNCLKQRQRHDNKYCYEHRCKTLMCDRPNYKNGYCTDCYNLNPSKTDSPFQCSNPKCTSEATKIASGWPGKYCQSCYNHVINVYNMSQKTGTTPYYRHYLN